MEVTRGRQVAAELAAVEVVMAEKAALDWPYTSTSFLAKEAEGEGGKWGTAQPHVLQLERPLALSRERCSDWGEGKERQVGRQIEMKENGCCCQTQEARGCPMDLWDLPTWRSPYQGVGTSKAPGAKYIPHHPPLLPIFDFGVFLCPLSTLAQISSQKRNQKFVL